MTYQTTDQVENLGQAGPPAPPPPRKRHGWWFVWIPGGLIAAIIAIATGTSGTTTTHVAPTPAPPVATAPANPAPATPAAPTLREQFTTWVNGGGMDQLTAVGTDLSSISADASAQDTAALANDGQQLATDAQTALDNPPPGWLAHNYSKAMTELVAAGTALQNGDYAGATAHITTATTYINKATHDVNNMSAVAAL